MIEEPKNDRVIGVELEHEMRQAYLDYSMSVIVARALPDVRDGLKPVQRRILYTMLEEGLRNDRPFRKSANVVGVVMAKYHPHGDVPIADALVRLAQDFAARYPLVQGQGNFGCFTGDTKVELYNGEQKTFSELVEMAHKGMRAEIFTVDAHRNVRIKPLRAPRLVRRNDPVVKLTLESGAEIVCTPDHRFMLRDGTYREAQQLKAKDQLMPFSRSAIPERLHRTGAFPIPASLSQKVSTVEPAGRADVYDLTVDLTQNFALAAGVFVHNSIDDDPPAPQPARDRGRHEAAHRRPGPHDRRPLRDRGRSGLSGWWRRSPLRRTAQRRDWRCRACRRDPSGLRAGPWANRRAREGAQRAAAGQPRRDHRDRIALRRE